MAKLMYNSATDTFTRRADINLIETPAAKGRFHNPYPFSDFADEVEFALNKNGLQVLSEEYAITKDDNRMFGMMEIAPISGELITADDWKLTVGLRGSHDQRIPRGIALGSQVMVCSNLCFHGNIGTFKTKQTTNIAKRLPVLIQDAVARIPQLAEFQQRKFDAYKNHDFKPRWGDAAIVELMRRGAFTAAQVSRAVKEWDVPSYDEHGELGYNVWRLFNASTEALKPTGNVVNMNNVQERSQKVAQFMNEIVGL